MVEKASTLCIGPSLGRHPLSFGFSVDEFMSVIMMAPMLLITPSNSHIPCSSPMAWQFQRLSLCVRVGAWVVIVGLLCLRIAAYVQVNSGYPRLYSSGISLSSLVSLRTHLVTQSWEVKIISQLVKIPRPSAKRRPGSPRCHDLRIYSTPTRRGDARGGLVVLAPCAHAAE